MFRLTEVRIQNFKCFKDTKVIKIEPRCTTLIGVNQAGKSYLLEAISYLGNDEEIPEKSWRRTKTTTPPTIEGWFEADDNTWLEILQGEFNKRILRKNRSKDRPLFNILSELKHLKIERDAEGRTIEFLSSRGKPIKDESLEEIAQTIKKLLWPPPILSKYKNEIKSLDGEKVLVDYLSRIKAFRKEGTTVETLNEMINDVNVSMGTKIFANQTRDFLIQKLTIYH